MWRYPVLVKFFYFSSVRWSRVPPVLAFICMAFHTVGQSLPAFEDAIDPVSLDYDEIYQHLDTTTGHRQPFSLSYLDREFPAGEILTIESYFQKSPDHHLLRLSQNSIVNNRLYVMAEGWGATYFKISDGHCTIIQTTLNNSDQKATPPYLKKCIY